MSAAIELHNLSKRYGSRPAYALRDLSLAVQPGEIYGFLGPNGAGKSTAIRLLLNFIQPTGGTAKVLGLDIVKDSVAVKKQVGYLAGEIALYRRLTGRQFLDYMAALQPLKDPAYRQRLVNDFGAQLDKPIEDLSKGNRQKIGLIQALMHQPDVLVLDEPTSGLDPLMQAVFYDTIQAARPRGAAVFLSSHDLTEVRKMCDRIGFIKDGRLVTEKTLSDLQAAAAHSFDVTFKERPPLDQLRALPASQIKSLTNQTVNVRVQGNLRPLLKILAAADVTALDKHELNLEDEFMELYEKEAAK